MPRMTSFMVLILVLVEDGLRAAIRSGSADFGGLNPCSCGGWSQRCSS